MANRFQDIIAEELGFPTTQDKIRAKKDWNELEAAIHEIDQNYIYTVFLHCFGVSIDDIVTAQPMTVPDTLTHFLVSGIDFASE